jgi:hypothetical protein
MARLSISRRRSPSAGAAAGVAGGAQARSISGEVPWSPGTADGVKAKAFFELLLQNTPEGFFSDPIYGGNRDMVGWKLIGFPGARYDYRPYVDKHGAQLDLPPVGLKGRPGWTSST